MQSAARRKANARSSSSRAAGGGAAPSADRSQVYRVAVSLRTGTRLVSLGVILAAATGCAYEQIGSELEFEAVGACGSAIEKRLGKTLPPGWRYGKEERDGQAVMKAWAPDRDPETMTPDYTCVVVADEDAQAGVRVVRVTEGDPSG